jgi:hypothetical protein
VHVGAHRVSNVGVEVRNRNVRGVRGSSGVAVATFGVRYKNRVVLGAGNNYNRICGRLSRYMEVEILLVRHDRISWTCSSEDERGTGRELA